MCLANAVRISLDVYRKEGKVTEVIRFGICKEVSRFRCFHDRTERQLKKTRHVEKLRLDGIYKHGLNL